jgi:hypothetical protein
MQIVKIWCGTVAAFGGFVLPLALHLSDFWVAALAWALHVFATMVFIHREGGR